MKNIKIILLLFVVFLTNSCSDFMEPDSLSTFDTKYVFSNVDDARKATNAIYATFGQDAFRSRLSSNFAGNTDIESGASSVADGRFSIWNLTPQPNNGDLKIVWQYAYKAIRDANIVIDGISTSEALQSSDPTVVANMKQFLGEAYTLRAYWYSMLTYTFGDVPFITAAPKAGVEFNLPREDRNVILSSVIQDMIKAEADMQWADQAKFGIEQVNREFTMGMIARLALQRGGYFLTPEMKQERKSDYKDYYEIARAYTQKLMALKDRKLPDFGKVFMNECTNVKPVNEDVLFEIPFAVGDGDVAWNLGIRVDAGVNNPYGSGSNYMAVPLPYLYSFDVKDTRRAVTCGLYTIDLTFTKLPVASNNISQGKWSREYLNPPPGASSSKGTGINWPMMRYSDVLLMYAEAENELNGPTASAQAALKTVRNRAFVVADQPICVDQYVTTVSANKTSFFNAIVNERAWEFGGEMIRKYELIRWGIYDKKMKETVDGLKKMSDETASGTSILPDKIYVKYDAAAKKPIVDAATGKLIILNLDGKVPDPGTGWMSYNWLSTIKNDPTKGGYPTWITTNWANYTYPVRYIMPIPSESITNSNGVLKNDGYNFNF